MSSEETTRPLLRAVGFLSVHCRIWLGGFAVIKIRMGVGMGDPLTHMTSCLTSIRASSWTFSLRLDLLSRKSGYE